MIDRSRFLERLQNVRRVHDQQYQASCPAHRDSEPSLSVTFTAERIPALLRRMLYGRHRGRPRAGVAGLVRRTDGYTFGGRRSGEAEKRRTGERNDRMG